MKSLLSHWNEWSKDGFDSIYISYFHRPRFPDDDRFAPPIGNGYLATNVFSDAIYVDGVFNGYREDIHRARIPSTASIRVTGDVNSEVYRLDMRNGRILNTKTLLNKISELSTKSLFESVFWYFQVCLFIKRTCLLVKWKRSILPIDCFRIYWLS